MFGLNSIVFRPHNVYGERQNIADRYRNVIGIFMNQILKGDPLTVFGDGLQTRAFSHVDDVAPVIASSVMNPKAYNETFNIGADTPYTILQLVDEISSAFRLPARVVHLPARNEVVHAFSDHSKIQAVFEPPNPMALQDGIKRMADWVKSRGTATPVKFTKIEIREKLPSGWEF